MKRLLLLLAVAAALSPSTLWAASPELKPFVRGSWQRVLVAHQQRPTLVHFWGPTCGPCKVELPLLGRFMHEHPDIDVVTISADLVPDQNGATRSMLDKSGLAAAENWIFSDGFAERLRFEIDPNWQGEIPRTILVGRDGVRTTIEGSTETAQLEKWSDQQAAAPAAAATPVSEREIKVGDLVIRQPWSRATPAGAKVGGGYLEIENRGASPDRLVAGSSDVAAKVEVHEMTMKDGVMTMRPAGGLVIEPGSTVKLAPGGYHLMFVDLKKPLKAGEEVAVTLEFEKAGKVNLPFAVQGLGAQGPAPGQPDGQMHPTDRHSGAKM